jgi:hypothetical protein
METAEQVAIPDPEVVPERTHSSKFSGKVLNIFQRTKIRELNPRQKKNYYMDRHNKIVIYEPSAGRRCSRMSAFFKARATKERVPLINARMYGRCLHASGSYNIFCTKIKLIFFVLIH